jgi:hypothetical protein
VFLDYLGMKKKQLPVTDRRQSMSPNPEEKYKHDNEVLVLQVEALQAQLDIVFFVCF